MIYKVVKLKTNLLKSKNVKNLHGKPTYLPFWASWHLLTQTVKSGSVPRTDKLSVTSLTHQQHRTYSLNKYLMNISYVSNSVLSNGDSAKNQTKILVLAGFIET